MIAYLNNKNWIVGLVLAGAIFLVSAISIFDLSATVSKGNKAQKAIQMLDKMRHPFLDIGQVRIKLIETSNPDLVSPALESAIKTGRDYLIQYKKLAAYNPEVAEAVDRLEIAYEKWIVEEKHLHFDYKHVFQKQNKDLLIKDHIIKDFGIAEKGFLQTMDTLGEGENPIHKDMDEGISANKMMMSFIGIFFLYLTGLLFLQQYLKVKALGLAQGELEEKVQDRTEALNQKTTFLSLLQSITAKANEASSFSNVMQYTLEQVCAYTHWPVGHVYIQDEHNNKNMVPSKIWCLNDPDKFLKFKKVTEKTQFDCGVGLPGRVVETKKPAWISDVTKDMNFPRAKLADDLGIRAAFAFPVIYDSEVIAVLEFFTDKAQDEPDESQIDVVTHIGLQLGHLAVRIQAEKALKKSEEEWRLTFNSTSDLVSIHDKDLRFLRANKSLADFLGKQPEDLVGKYCYDAFHCSQEQIDRCGSAENEHVNLAEIVDDPLLGVPLHITKSPLQDSAGNVTGFVHVARDISERREFEKRLEHLAHYDHLTGLPNRTLFTDRVEQVIARAPWNDRILAVLYLDLDRFKILNDTFGHDMGDELLREVARRLKSLVRHGDSVTRLGGDEFAISLVDIASKEDIEQVARKLNKTLSDPFNINNKEVFVTASIGISMFPYDGETVDGLLKLADIAMYGAKSKGKNTYLFYTSEINSRLSRQIDMEEDLRHALQRNEFELYYQPRVDLKTGSIVGMEALLRWQSAKFGFVQPAMFIPFLEDTGLIVAVGDWVIREACRQSKLWQEEGHKNLVVSVNVSARQFIQNNLVDSVCQALSDNKLKPECLELEITESVLLEHMDEALTSLNELERLGVLLTIDDFGTGYSSLTYLKRFPIHILKIDKSFINEVTLNENDTALTRAIISIAKNLNLSVIAEGVETNKQLNFLIENHCDQMQGYLYSKPLAAIDFKKLLLEKHQLDLSNGKVKKSASG